MPGKITKQEQLQSLVNAVKDPLGKMAKGTERKIKLGDSFDITSPEINPLDAAASAMAAKNEAQAAQDPSIAAKLAAMQAARERFNQQNQERLMQLPSVKAKLQQDQYNKEQESPILQEEEFKQRLKRFNQGM